MEEERGERKKKYRFEEKERDVALLLNSLAAKRLSIDEIYEMRAPLEPRFHRSALIVGREQFVSVFEN